MSKSLRVVMLLAAGVVSTNYAVYLSPGMKHKVCSWMSPNVEEESEDQTNETNSED